MSLKDFLIFENDDFVAINKPSGLLSIPDREGKEESLKTMLKEKYGNIFTVHRLDRDTSGLIVFAKNEPTHKYLSQLFEKRLMKKIYAGLVIGSPAKQKGSINLPLAENMVQRGVMIVNPRGKESLTDYEVIEDFTIYAWMQFQIHTGRTHQIRVHMKEIGYPIVCDPVYGDGKPVLISSFKKKYNLTKDELEERPILGRLALHSFQLSFKDMQGKQIELEAQLSKDLRATLQQLRKRKTK